MTKQAYQVAEIHTGTAVLYSQALLTENDIVVGFLPAVSVPSDFPVHDYSNCLLAPGFVDMQLYGGNGKLFSNTPDVACLDATYAACVAGGCAHFMITLATSSMDTIEQGIDAVNAYIRSGKKGLLGLHLEGPWINPEKRGAHVESLIRKPTATDIEDLLEKSRGAIRMITLAPEQCPDNLILALMDNGILVSAGHSNASYAQAKRGFDLGIPAATHLFNAMSPFQGRQPGMVGAIYDDANVMSSIICDGVHVDFESVRISKKIMGDRLFFITDAVTPIREGNYQHVFQGDRYTLPDGTLSGSCITMLSTFKNAVRRAGLSVEESVKMCSSYPAGLLKHPYIGRIQVGQRSDFNIIDCETLELVRSVF